MGGQHGLKDGCMRGVGRRRVPGGCAGLGCRARGIGLMPARLHGWLAQISSAGVKKALAPQTYDKRRARAQSWGRPAGM